MCFSKDIYKFEIYVIIQIKNSKKQKVYYGISRF